MNNIVDYIKERIEHMKSKPEHELFYGIAIIELQAVLSKIEELNK